MVVGASLKLGELCLKWITPWWCSDRAAVDEMKAGPSVLPSPFTVWRHLRFWVTGCSCCHRFLGVRGPFAMRWCVPGFRCSVACVVDTQRSPEIKGTFAVVVGFVMASSQIPNWLRQLLTIRSRDWSFSFVFRCKWFRKLFRWVTGDWKAAVAAVRRDTFSSVL